MSVSAFNPTVSPAARFGDHPPVYTPMPAGAVAQSQAQPALAPLWQLAGQIGTQTQVGMDGIVRFNMPLVNQIKAYREQALPVLNDVLSRTTFVPTFLEALYTAEEMAEDGVSNVSSLYPVVSKWNTHPDPLVQIYLAGFYREIKIPTTFGPLMATLMNTSVNRYPMQSSPMYNITEEVGGTILEQIAEYTSQKTVNKLLPYIASSAQSYPARAPQR